jgi:hypothetical protein
MATNSIGLAYRLLTLTVLLGCAPAFGQAGSAKAIWLPSDAAMRRVPAALLAQLREDPYAYFRFVNKPWALRVCREFAGEITVLPRVRLHGDAHLEQYAYTEKDYGLDDFDDSAEGPSVVDLVRFTGSLHLASRRRNWTAGLDGVIDQFFRGYRAGLKDPAYVAPVPRVVTRLRSAARRDPAAFLEWAESIMLPVSAQLVEEARQSLELVVPRMAAIRPGFTREQFAIKKIGTIRLGIGSLLTVKLLMRVEGPSAAAGDDLILESKELSDLTGVSCLYVPSVGESVRVIDGAEQIGRLRHDVLSVVPKPASVGPEVRDRWIRSWDYSYGEVNIDDLASVEELKEIAHDVGVQLGAANLSDREQSAEARLRIRELETVARLEPRIRALARQMSREIVDASKRLRAAPARRP